MQTTKPFDNDLYLKIQTDNITKRIASFGGKLYLEFGGKLFDDYHASRVLPGFQPDSKLKVLLSMKDKAEIVFAINSRHIIANKVRADSGISYTSEVERLIDAYTDCGLYVGGVVFSFYENNPAVNTFIRKLNKSGFKTYKHYAIEGYPQNTQNVFGDHGFIHNDYVETTRPLVVVTAPGPGSGKMAVCLSNLYHDFKRGITSGYAKYETFPVWNLPLKHPVNLAYEAATADLEDVNMIDPYHLEAYGIVATNYNRDVENFPILKNIFEKIYGKSPYKSPTDMGVNMVGFAIKDEVGVIVASNQEILRRHYDAQKNAYLGKITTKIDERIDYLMQMQDLKEEDRFCVAKCLAKAAKTGEPAMAIQLEDKKIIAGKRTPLLGAAAATLLNCLKYLANIDKKVLLISPEILNPICELKTGPFEKHNPRIRAEEILIALAIQAVTSEDAKKALAQLPKLRHAQAHSSCIMSTTDLKTLKSLGIDVTEEPVAYAHKLYF
ncbi:MAG: DUF1846 domain-containing protein [Bacilli bacterium]|nr:DUF1846 domain-containing protein [Bacilli bacterium]